MRNKVVTVPQIFTLLFITRFIMCIAYINIGVDMWTMAVSSLISYVFTFILVIPLYFFNKKYPSYTIGECSNILLGKFGIIITVIFGLQFLLSGCRTMYDFDIFVQKTQHTNISPHIILICLILASCYGALKGIEGLCRSSGFIIIALVIGIIFIVTALFPKIDGYNFTPIFINDFNGILDGVIFFISQTICVPILLYLLPMAKGNKVKGFVIWNSLIYGLLFILFIIINGALGNYLDTSEFPVYTATVVAEIGILQRLEAFYIGLWAAGLFLRLSLIIYLITLCLKDIFKIERYKYTIWFVGVMLLCFSHLLNKSDTLSKYIYNPAINFCTVIFTSIIIPVILLIVGARRKNNEN